MDELFTELINGTNKGILSDIQLEVIIRRSQNPIYCDTKAINSFFMTFGFLYDRDKRLIFNMDETQLSSLKSLKILTA